LPVIKQIIQENHQVAIFFIKELASLLGNADENTVNLTQKHLRGRLAEALLRLKESYGSNNNYENRHILRNKCAALFENSQHEILLLPSMYTEF
jgi:CRP-like cAMP-binding protein